MCEESFFGLLDSSLEPVLIVFSALFYVVDLEKEMATLSSILAWRIPWREEPGRLQSTGSQRVGHDWATSLHFTYVVDIEQYQVYVYLRI